MTPAAAWASEIFRIYAGVTLGLLALAGVLLAVLRWGLGRNVGHAWQSYTSWLVMVPLVLGGIFAGRVPVIVLLGLLAVFAFKEYARATGLYRDWLMTGVVYLGIVAVAVVSAVYDPGEHLPGWYGLFAILPVYVIAAILLMPILRNRAGPASGDRPGHPGFPLHRLDVRPPGVSGQHPRRLRLSALSDFRRRGQRHCRLHVRQAGGPLSAAEQHQPEEDLGRGRWGRWPCRWRCPGCCGSRFPTSRRWN